MVSGIGDPLKKQELEPVGITTARYLIYEEEQTTSVLKNQKMKITDDLFGLVEYYYWGVIAWGVVGIKKEVKSIILRHVWNIRNF